MQSLKTILAVVLTAGVLVGIIGFGRWARDDLTRSGHFIVKFADIDCPAPAGLSKADFLGEVQYLGGFPDEFDRTQPHITDRLMMAFARHPWVESAGPTEWARPPKVGLTFRRPCLIVSGRVYDRLGFMLPKNASTADLPELVEIESPRGDQSGQVSKNGLIVEAAGAVAQIREAGPSHVFRYIKASPNGWTLERLDGARLMLKRPMPGVSKEAAEKLRSWGTGDLHL